MKYCLFGIFFWFPSLLFSQSADFQDSYDYDLRKQKSESSIGTDYFQEYNLPPKRPSNSVLNPKAVQKQLDSSLILPASSPFRRNASSSTNTNTTTTPTANPLAPTANTNLPIDPLTGELNASAILRNNNNERELKQKKREREILEFQKQEYKETNFRRGEIIFFMTFPFAVGITAAFAFAIETGQNGFMKSQNGSIFMLGGSFGLSLGNVWLDHTRYNEFMDEKKRNPGLNWRDRGKFEENFYFTIPIYTFHF